ncbi:MAG: hypothetical protein FJ297_16980 [Planctomycetes bacterium]|nr:hypothetical protein [Planctomycetota bacterium]
MPTDAETELVFRTFEREVLDKHYTTLAIWRRDRSTAVYAALAQFDCFAILSLCGPPALSGIGTTQILKNLEEGLAEALRWLHNGNPQIDLTPTDDPKIIGEAGEFCGFAGKYVDIADFHKMYGRGQVEIEVDEPSRTVRFLTPKGRLLAASLIGMAEQSHRLGKLPVVADPSSRAELGKKIFTLLSETNFRYESGHIVLADASIANREMIKELFDQAMPEEPLPLDEEEDLIGFTAGEFEKFFAALRRWSFCCTFGFLLSITKWGKQQWECAPTQCIARTEFLESMQSLTALPRTTVEAIVQRLTYDCKAKWPDVYQQPLFCGANTVTWSASVIQNSKQLRNMLKLMSRTKSLQDHAANLIGSREGRMLWELGHMLSRRGKTEYKLTTSISCGDDKGEVDLVAYNRKLPDELLIVEGKAGLGVDEINEVDAATTEMQGGQEQLANVRGILARMSDGEKAAIFKFVNWSLVKRVYGVVVSADAEPNDRYDHSEYPGISLQTIRARLRDNHFGSPQKFWRACKERNWMNKLRAYTERYSPISVGEVTYELPVLVEPADDADERHRKDMERMMREFEDSTTPRERSTKPRKRRRR